MRGKLEQQGGDPAYIQKRKDAQREQRERQQHENEIEIIRALNRISDQLAADEQEEKTDHRKKAFREWATIILIFATVLAAGIGDVFFYGQMTAMQTANSNSREDIGKQLALMQGQLDAAITQANASKSAAEAGEQNLIANQRAWLGTSAMNIGGWDRRGEGIGVEIQYRNSGREPALETLVVHSDWISPLSDWYGGTAANKIIEWRDGCLAVIRDRQGYESHISDKRPLDL